MYICLLLLPYEILAQLDLTFRSLQVINTYIIEPSLERIVEDYDPVRYRVGDQLRQVAQGAY